MKDLTNTVTVVQATGGWKTEIPAWWISPNSPNHQRSRSLRTYATKRQAQQAATKWRKWARDSRIGTR